MGQTLTLTGYLGKDPQTRTTQSRTYVQKLSRREQFVFEHGGRRVFDDHDVVDERAEVEVTTTPRTFAVLSLATHEWKGGKRTTTWHRIVAWSIDQLHFGIRRLGKGDKVEITGRESSYTTPDGREIQQIELISWKLLQRKLRPQAQELPTPRRETAKPIAPMFRTCDGRWIPLAATAAGA